MTRKNEMAARAISPLLLQVVFSYLTETPKCCAAPSGSPLKARTGFGKLLRRVEDERRSLLIEKRSTPEAVLLSIRDYVRLAAPEPEVLRIIGEESREKGTDRLTSRQIDQAIKASRAEKPKRG